MSDPWAFGWTQLLTLIGFAITIGIAAGGYQTFSRWKRQKIEERRISSAMLVFDSRMSSANGAFGRHERHDNAGMRLVTAAFG